MHTVYGNLHQGSHHDVFSYYGENGVETDPFRDDVSGSSYDQNPFDENCLPIDEMIDATSIGHHHRRLLLHLPQVLFA